MDRRAFPRGGAVPAGAAAARLSLSSQRNGAPAGELQPQPASLGRAGRDFPKVGGTPADQNYSTLKSNAPDVSKRRAAEPIAKSGCRRTLHAR